MEKPFSILDLVCDEEGNPIKTEIHEYIEKIEKENKLVPIYKRAYKSMTDYALEQRDRLDSIEDYCEKTLVATDSFPNWCKPSREVATKVLSIINQEKRPTP